MEQVSKIVACRVTYEWMNPDKKMVYYHELKLQNGETVSVGLMEKEPSKVAVGATITYNVDPKNAERIKITASNMEAPKQQQNNAKSYGKNNGLNKQEQFLGYAWSYAKDLIVAGKGIRDVEELKQVAHFIYNEIGKQMTEGQK